MRMLSDFLVVMDIASNNIKKTKKNKKKHKKENKKQSKRLHKKEKQIT